MASPVGGSGGSCALIGRTVGPVAKDRLARLPNLRFQFGTSNAVLRRPESESTRLGVVRKLAMSVVQAVEADDIGGAVAGARALVTFLESLVRGEPGDANSGKDKGMRAGLASARPAPDPACLALPVAA